MFLSDLSIKRPVLASVMMLALLTLGIFSYRRLAIDFFPDVEIPVVSVVTVYPGGAPESVEREVSKPIEEAVNPIAGVRHVGSISLEGVSQVWVEFELGVRVNDAAQETRAKIAAIRGDLPQGIEEPVIQKLDFNAMPIVSVSVRSTKLGPRELTTLVDKKIQRRLQNISGVGKVDLVGPSTREVSVDLKPDRLEALNMGVDEVVAGLASENVNTPLGRLASGSTEVSLRISGKPEEVPRFADMVIARRGQRPITLGEVATVRDGIEEQRSLALVDGVPAVALDILKQSGANTVDTVDGVIREVAALGAEMPEGTTIEVVRDSSVWIRESVADVKQTMILGGLLTVLIVFCFLNSWRSTVITGLTLPISVIASFIVMNFMGMTLNVITLMGLSLAIGLLIDDAIVVRENIVRHLEKGEDHFSAARNGTAEIGLAVLATSASIMAVFVPVAFMKGIIGRIFFHFGITVAFAVLVSLFVSFTLDPMLSSRWHDPDIDRRGRRRFLNRLLDYFNDWFERTAERYRSVIAWALDHRGLVLGAAGIAFVGGLVVFSLVQSEFMAPFDQGEFQVNLKTAPDASMVETQDRVGEILKLLSTTPEVALTYATIGAGDAGTVRNASIYVKLKDRSERSKDQNAVQRDLRAKLDGVAGIIFAFAEAGSLDNRKLVEARVRGDDLEVLKTYAAELKQKMYAIPGLVDLEMSLEQETPEYRLVVDRERASSSGVSSAVLVRTLGALVGGQAVSTFEDEDGDAVDVRVRLPEGERSSMAQVANLRLAVQQPGGSPALVPVSSLATYERTSTPREIIRQDLAREVVVSANLDGLPLGTAMQQVQALADKLDLPPGYSVLMGGQSEIMVESFQYLGEALLLAVIMVYLILAAQFESFLHPLAIMLSLPLSIVGMAGMLLLTGDTINIMSLIGLIMLMGLVTKNAILLVDFTNTLRGRGLDRRSALIQAGRTRLRPIMMTTVAMIFGMLPLALAIGAGAEMRAPMARAVVGGLITSTLLTLIVVPVVYTLLDDFAAWLKRRWAGEQAAEAGSSIAAGLLMVLLLAGAVTPALAAEPVGAFTEQASVAASESAPLVLSLDEALAVAAEKSYDIRRAEEYRRWLHQRYVEERAAAFPHLKLTAGGLRNHDESQRAFFRDIPPEFAGIFSFQQDIANGELSLSQPLFTWGQVGAAIRGAKFALSTGDDQLRRFRQAVARDVSAAFYDVLLSRQLVAIAQQNLDQKKRHLDETERRLALGTATDYDVLAARVAVDNAKPELIRATNAVLTAREQLRFLLAEEGRQVDARGDLEVTPGPPPDYDEVLKAARENRPELAEVDHQKLVMQEVVKIYGADDRPRLDLRAGFGWQFMDVGELTTDGKQWNAGVYLTFPIFDGLRTRARVAQARSDAASLEIQETKLDEGIALEVRTAVDAVSEAAQILTALSGTVEQAERLLHMAEKGFELGVTRKLEVDDAQVNLSSARVNFARAQRDYRVAQVNLEWVSGRLGER